MSTTTLILTHTFYKLRGYIFCSLVLEALLAFQFRYKERKETRKESTSVLLNIINDSCYIMLFPCGQK